MQWASRIDWWLSHPIEQKFTLNFINLPPNIPDTKTFNDDQKKATINSVIFLQQTIPNLPRPASLSTVTSESRVDRWLHNCSPWNFGEAGLGWQKQRLFLFRQRLFLPGNPLHLALYGMCKFKCIWYIHVYTPLVSYIYIDIYIYIFTLFGHFFSL